MGLVRGCHNAKHGQVLEKALPARLTRYLSALRHKGPRRLFLERYNHYVNYRFLRRLVYPKLAEWQFRELRHDNAQRRAQLRARAHRPPPGRVFVVICVDAEGPNLLGESHDWNAVEAEVRAFSEPSFRSSLADSRGHPFSVDWFVVDWLGPGPNQRGLAVGCHGILDRYTPLVEAARGRGYADAIHWHYHHVPEGRIDGMNRDWLNSPRYEEILSRRLLERSLFHTVYRAGNTWEDDACSNWLERFIPFDLSNRGPHKNVHYDWSRAPRNWTLYHPDSLDVQRPGRQQRLMGRSLDVEKNTFRPEEVEQAFLDAAEGRDSYVSFYMHDFNCMRRLTAQGIATVRAVAADYTEVEWSFLDALELFRKFGKLDASAPFKLDRALSDGELTVSSNKPVFGEPWLALKHAGRFVRQDMRRITQTTFRAKLPSAPSPELIAVAAADLAGQTSVLKL